MAKQGGTPDAWDDDWETQANKEVYPTPAESKSQPQQTRAERLAQHVEDNRKLWESAETPDTFHFLQANNNVPLATTFKPQVKVLSRRPVIAKRDPATGMSQLSLDDDPAEGAKRDNQPTPEEIRARQKQEREEKQRRYDEARAKIFGEPLPSSGASSPGTVTPPRSDGQRTPRGRGRGRGGSNIPRNNERNNGESSQSGSNRRNNMQPGPGRELYDPNYSPKPDSPAQGRGSDNRPQVRSSAPKSEQPAIRAPRGPTTSGRGGFGFAKRGGKET